MKKGQGEKSDAIVSIRVIRKRFRCKLTPLFIDVETRLRGSSIEKGHYSCEVPLSLQNQFKSLVLCKWCHVLLKEKLHTTLLVYRHGPGVVESTSHENV